jgi:hypothetical protein
MAACNLTPTPNDPLVDFRGTPGTVTIEVIGTLGSIQFIQARYNNVPIPGLPSSQITFTIVSGDTNLEVVYALSDPVNGAGALFEVCDAHTRLIAVIAAHPAVRYHISA